MARGRYFDLDYGAMDRPVRCVVLALFHRFRFAAIRTKAAFRRGFDRTNFANHRDWASWERCQRHGPARAIPPR
jgi:hypothetical protein